MTDEYVEVVGPSGSTFEVLNDIEADFWNRSRDRYLEQFKFENITDLLDLDRVLTGELLSFRLSYWILHEGDYDSRAIDDTEMGALQRKRIETEKETRLLKEKMGLNRGRRQDSDQQAVWEYLNNLRSRAKEFGVHRDMQIAKSMDLLHELFTQVGIYNRGDEEERTHLKCNAEDILKWVSEVAQPEYNALDDAFRKNQKLWLKEVS